MSLKKATPWLVLNGSGPAVDMISELLSELSPLASPVDWEGRDSPSTELRDRVRELVKRHFPSRTNLEKLVDQVREGGRENIVSVFQILHEEISQGLS